MRRFTKQVNEDFTIGVDFDGQLPGVATVSTATVSAARKSDGVADNTVLESTTATIDGTEAQVKVLAGTHGESYKITFIVTLSNGDTLEEDLMMRVENQ